MILYHKNLKIDPELLSLKKKIKYSDNFIYIPIKYNGKDILLQFIGTDASEFFNELHQPSILEDYAENYKIGELN